MPALSLASEKPSKRVQLTAIAIAAALALAFLILLPVSTVQLGRSNVFVPMAMACIVILDLLTAALLLDDFLRRNHPSVLVLLQGYLFSALIAVPYAVSFPRAMSDDSPFFFGGLQTTTWIYTFWHLMFPVAVLAYALLKDKPQRLHDRPGASLAVSTGVTCLAVAAILFISAGAERWLPQVNVDERIVTHRVQIIAVVCASAAAVALLTLWLRRRSTLDVWLMTAMSAAIMEPLLIGLLGGDRYTVGFYLSRVFSVTVSAVVLIALLVETRFLYQRNTELGARLRQEQQSRLLTIDAVLGSVVHELRQPIAAISFNADTLKLVVDKDLRSQSVEADAILQAILRDSSRMGALLSEIRGWVRNTDAAPEAVDINAAVQECLAIEQRELDANSVTVSVLLEGHLPPASCKHIQLTHVLLNLFQNANDALRATPAANRRLLVSTGQSREGQIVITVEDTGGGIDIQRMDEMFQPFVTTKMTGTGLGLSISRMIVERFGGSLLASNGQRGAVLQVFLWPWSATERES